MNPNWPQLVLDAYGEGKSDLAVCKILGISRKKFMDAYSRNNSFRELVDYGRELSEAWWEDKARENIGNKNFNTNLYKAYMQQKFDWSDKVDTKNANLNLETDVAKLKEELHSRLETLKLLPSEPVKAIAHEATE